MMVQIPPLGNDIHTGLRQPFVVRLVDSHLFHLLVIFIIVVSAVILGLETDPSFSVSNADTLHLLEHYLVGFFVVEILIQAFAEAKRYDNGKRLWYRYLTNPWHIFDVIVVAICLLPLHTEFSPCCVLPVFYGYSC